MQIHRLSQEEAIKALRSTPIGLDEQEVFRRLEEFGPNEIKREKKTALVLRFLKQFTHFFAILLWVAAAFSFVAEYMQPDEGMLILGWAIVVVIFINGIFSFVQEFKAEKAAEALARMLPPQVKTLRGGDMKEVSADQIVPGDIILLEAGNRVPADSRLIEGFGLKVDNAPLTGESVAQPRTAVASDEAELTESPNVVFAGTSVVAGRGKGVVFATGMSTEFGKIASLTQTTEADLSPLQKQITKITHLVAVLAVGMGALIFLIGMKIGLSFWENSIFAIGIIVANVPEGLLPTVTLALAMGSQRMAKKKALMKTLSAVETLGSTTVICTDKTGTLTENRMEVERVLVDYENFIYHGHSLVTEAGKPISPERMKAIEPFFKIGLLCNDAKPAGGKGGEAMLGDPTEIALWTFSHAFFKTDLPDLPRINEFPFDSDRKRMTTIHETSHSPENGAATSSLENGAATSSLENGAATRGEIAYTKGAAEVVLPLCGRMLVGGKEKVLGPEEREMVLAMNQEYGTTGLRVLALAYRLLPAGMKDHGEEEVETDLVFVGLVGMKDPPRSEVPAALEACRRAGIRVIMITGDNPHTAEAIARQIGLVKSEEVRVVTGADLKKMRDEELIEVLDLPEVIFARVTAEHKMRVVSALKEKGAVVAVTGDGVNDAPALKRADIGIAMGIAGTDVAKEAADMILLDDNFASIVNAIEEGRAVYDNIRKFITYIFASNIPEIIPYLAFILFRIPLPLTIIQILAVDLGTDMVPALGLGAERPLPEVMNRPPRSPEEKLLNLPLLLRAYLFLGPIEAIAGMAGYFAILFSAGWAWGTMLSPNDPVYLQATTACLTAIVITQVGNVFACRSNRESAFSIGFFTNRMILWGIAAEITLILFIVYHPWGNLIFGTAPLPLWVWLFLVPFAPLLLLAEEGRKALVRRAAAKVPEPEAAPPLSATAVQAVQSVEAIHKILVPIQLGALSYSRHAIELACRIGEQQRSQLLLVYVIEVPWSAPIGAPMPAVEKQARKILKETEMMVGLHQLPCQTAIRRARVGAQEILRIAQKEHVDLIVIGVVPYMTAGNVLWNTMTIFSEAPCQVIMAKSPPR